MKSSTTDRSLRGFDPAKLKARNVRVGLFAAVASAPLGRLFNIRITHAVAGAALVACALGLHSPAAEASTGNVLFSFNGTDGQEPWVGSRLLNVNGTLYGMTLQGGAGNCKCGALYSLNPTTGVETVLYSFSGMQDGGTPFGDLINVNGTLFGTTSSNGTNGYGTVFSFNPMTGVETALYSFGNNASKDGQNPEAGLIKVGGKLYGAALRGGTYGEGALFSFNLKTGAETVLWSFGNGTDGQQPRARLINVNGTLYGTTVGGGSSSDGTVFSFNPQTGAETVLYSFGASSTDGKNPYDNLINVNGTLYGTTLGGGANGTGTVFSASAATGVETVLHSFGASGTGDGQTPAAGLIRIGDRLYGTTVYGGTGTNDNGTVFSLNPATGIEKVLYSFAGGTDGANPADPLIRYNGTLYGTTGYGGAYGDGTVFSIVP